MAKLNDMCKNCARLGSACKGTANSVWTGCIYKVPTSAAQDSPYIPIMSREDMEEKRVDISALRRAMQ